MNERDAYGSFSHLYENTISNQELIQQPCDVLIPAAIGGVITEDNAEFIQAQFIVEAANGPTTIEAVQILQDRDILVVPDILANSGGVIVSYFEWCQNIQGYYWSEEMVDDRLKDIIRKSFAEVYKTSVESDVNMKLAAYMVGVRTIAEASRYRGWIS